LKDWNQLTYLDVRKTKVTAAGIDGLKKALPRCKIEWDGGTIEPNAAAAPDRKAAEWVQSIGGTIHVQENGEEGEIGAGGELPRGEVELTGVMLSDKPKVSDEGLACFKDCQNLRRLNLVLTGVSDAGLTNFRNCKNLTALELASTKVSDAGLAY